MLTKEDIKEINELIRRYDVYTRFRDTNVEAKMVKTPTSGAIGIILTPEEVDFVVTAKMKAVEKQLREFGVEI